MPEEKPLYRPNLPTRKMLIPFSSHQFFSAKKHAKFKRDLICDHWRRLGKLHPVFVERTADPEADRLASPKSQNSAIWWGEKQEEAAAEIAQKARDSEGGEETLLSGA